MSAGGETELPLSSRKSRAQLSYLALQPGVAHPRDKLSLLLWSQTGASAARTNLRQSLASVRKSLSSINGNFILSRGESLEFQLESSVVDALEFDAAARQQSLSSMEHAVSLYKGELLDGLALVGEPFDEWLGTERRRYHETFLQLLHGLLKRYTDEQRTTDAIAIAIRLLAADPLQESVHRTLMECYVAEGRRGAAQQQYENCRQTLMDELGVKPELDTQRLYKSLLSGPLQLSEVKVPAGRLCQTDQIGSQPADFLGRISPETTTDIAADALVEGNDAGYWQSILRRTVTGKPWAATIVLFTCAALVAWHVNDTDKDKQP